MYLQFLFEKDDELSPEARFFLIKYLLVFGHAEEVLVGVKGLIKELDINDRGVKRSLEILTRRGYLNLVRLPKTGRGRPKYGVSAGERLLLEIDRWSTSYRKIIHANLIKSLFRDEHADDVECESRKKLKKSGKLLLAVLYAHADKHGDLEGLGFAELTALTGLNKVQIRGLIGVLSYQGRVISYFPGGGD
jgi:DNA-binding MarR family transcriptional regulator